MENNPVIILGINPIGKIAKEIFDAHQVVTYGFLDDHTTDEMIDEVPVLGKMDDASSLKLLGKDCNAFVAIDELKLRKSLVKSLEKEYKSVPVNAIHAKATISPSAYFEYGNFIDIGATINSFSKIGSHNIIKANALIDCGVEIGDFVQIGAGAIISSDVTIADDVFIGSGVVIVSGVKISKGARIGAGSVVVGNVSAGATVFGNPAKEV